MSRPIHQPVSADAGQIVSFTCSATGGVPPFTYSWTFGDGSGATGQNVTHIFSSPGTMNVQCSVSDKSQTTSQNTTSVIVLSDPSIILQTVNPTSLDVGQSATFAVQVTGGSGVYTYEWMNLPPGCNSTSATSISCQPTAIGTFGVTANVTDSNGFSVVTSALPISVYSALSLTSFTASPSKLDIGQTITFAASAIGGSGDLSFGYYSPPTGCDSANSTSLSCTPTTTGTYRVIATVTDSNGFTVSSGRITITINSDPTSTIIASPASIDLGQALIFTVNTSGGTGPFSYTYVTSSLGCTGLTSPSLSCTPSTTGNYTVETSVTDATGQVSTANLSVKVSPIIQISNFTTSAASLGTGQEFTLTLSTSGGTSPLSYSYSGLPPNCPSLNSPVLHCTPSISGAYSIQVTVTDHAGKATTSSLNVTVHQTQITGLSASQEYLFFGAVIGAFISAIVGATILLRRK